MDFEQEEPERELLYHYCDVAAFESIIRTNALWLSPFRQSNDSEEGVRAQKMLIDLALKYGLSDDEVAEFRQTLSYQPLFQDCYGLCLSERGDLLSQWRGYAADGAGFSIGFDPEVLHALPPFPNVNNSVFGVTDPKLHRVLYAEDEQIQELKPWFDSMKDHVKDGCLAVLGSLNEVATSEISNLVRANLELRRKLTEGLDRLYKIKGHAFREEQEWRLVSLAYQLSGFSFKYRISRGVLIPYLEYPMPNRSQAQSVISHVYLGPKNRTSLYIVRMLLNQFDLEDVTVCNSSASYR